MEGATDGRSVRRASSRRGGMTPKAPDSAARAAACREPPSPCPGRLDTVTRVRREPARLYREARAGRLDVGDASRLAHILQILGRMIEGAELEARVEALERARGAGHG